MLSKQSARAFGYRLGLVKAGVLRGHSPGLESLQESLGIPATTFDIPAGAAGGILGAAGGAGAGALSGLLSEQEGNKSQLKKILRRALVGGAVGGLLGGGATGLLRARGRRSESSNAS